LIRPLYYISWAILFFYFQIWHLFLLYWFLPFISFFQLIVRWGAICEHKYNVPSTDLVETTPIIILSWWERLLLPNLNFSYHLYHHFSPGISWSNLPKVHAIYAREGLVKDENVFHGYADYFRYLQKSGVAISDLKPRPHETAL
jgi:fatty acid desaturase